MEIDGQTTVAEIARNLPSAVRFFEKVNIDYCCGGSVELKRACETVDRDFETVLLTLETLQETSQFQGPEKDWNAASISELITHIVEKHHRVVQSEVPRLLELIYKMCGAHAESRPEFPKIRDLVNLLEDELFAHLQKEEEILFPYVLQLARSNPRKTLPASCFGSVSNPIGVMVHEHEKAGRMLAQINSLLVDRTGCPSCLSFFKTFEEFEKDLHQHIHLENNILFPRSIELEKSRKS
jgi:regulator of cell morphogenesis and NO signaling